MLSSIVLSDATSGAALPDVKDAKSGANPTVAFTSDQIEKFALTIIASSHHLKEWVPGCIAAKRDLLKYLQNLLNLNEPTNIDKLTLVSRLKALHKVGLFFDQDEFAKNIINDIDNNNGKKILAAIGNPDRVDFIQYLYNQDSELQHAAKHKHIDLAYQYFTLGKQYFILKNFRFAEKFYTATLYLARHNDVKYDEKQLNVFRRERANSLLEFIDDLLKADNVIEVKKRLQAALNDMNDIAEADRVYFDFFTYDQLQVYINISLRAIAVNICDEARKNAETHPDDAMRLYRDAIKTLQEISPQHVNDALAIQEYQSNLYHLLRTKAHVIRIQGMGLQGMFESEKAHTYYVNAHTMLCEIPESQRSAEDVTNLKSLKEMMAESLDSRSKELVALASCDEDIGNHAKSAKTHTRAIAIFQKALPGHEDTIKITERLNLIYQIGEQLRDNKQYDAAIYYYNAMIIACNKLEPRFRSSSIDNALLCARKKLLFVSTIQVQENYKVKNTRETIRYGIIALITRRNIPGEMKEQDIAKDNQHILRGLKVLFFPKPNTPKTPASSPTLEDVAVDYPDMPKTNPWLTT